jgi:hypothetical protein
MLDELNTRVVTPMFTLPRHPNDFKMQTMQAIQREISSAPAFKSLSNAFFSPHRILSPSLTAYASASNNPDQVGQA